MNVKMNMVPGRRLRGTPAVGDLFQIEMRDRLVVPGRVISTTVPVLGVETTFLLYLFKPGSTNHLVADLLVPPLLIVPKVWTMGYFLPLGGRPIFKGGERYPRHCFRDSMGRYFDDDGHPVRTPFEPQILRALFPPGAIDDTVSKALGIRLAEETA